MRPHRSHISESAYREKTQAENLNKYADTADYKNNFITLARKIEAKP